MAFCGNCGTRLDGNERFCAACGAGVPGQTASSGAGAAAAPPPAPAAAAVPAPAVAIPAPVGPAGAAPVGVGTPPAVGASRGGGMLWLVVAVVGLLAGGSYLWKHRPAGTDGGAPSAPAQQAPQDPAVLAQQQSFSGHWRAIYGFVELTNTSWTNHATVAIQSATLECDQFAANGNKLSEMQMKLNGPVAPGATATFNPFQMGSVSTYMTRVTCSIVAVAPAS